MEGGRGYSMEGRRGYTTEGQATPWREGGARAGQMLSNHNHGCSGNRWKCKRFDFEGLRQWQHCN